MAGRKAIFVDRDGTLNVNIDYLSDPDKYQLYPGVAEGLKALRDAGFIIVVITNQSGIGRGIFDHPTLARIHERMKQELARGGASVDGIYYCPHHPDENCACRKPGTVLFKKAIEEHGIDPKRSYVIGDMYIDIAAGKRIGARTAFVPEPKNLDRARKELPSWEIGPDFFGRDFQSAVSWILQCEKGN
jgi:histidinol-phosphate phosphatase family protein